MVGQQILDLFIGVQIPDSQLIRLARRARSQLKPRVETFWVNEVNRRNMPFFVYFLKDEVGHLYIGQTNNLHNREKQQISKSSKAAKFIKDGKGFQLVFYEEYKTRLESMRREKQLKGWTRMKKEALIKGNLTLLKKL